MMMMKIPLPLLSQDLELLLPSLPQDLELPLPPLPYDPELPLHPLLMHKLLQLLQEGTDKEAEIEVAKESEDVPLSIMKVDVAVNLKENIDDLEKFEDGNLLWEQPQMLTIKKMSEAANRKNEKIDSNLSQPISYEEQRKKEKIDNNKQPISRIGHKQDNEGRSPYGAAIFQSVSILIVTGMGVDSN
nr:hypothetical protein [Tanacetum cinerariifolium]